MSSTRKRLKEERGRVKDVSPRGRRRPEGIGGLTFIRRVVREIRESVMKEDLRVVTGMV